MHCLQHLITRRALAAAFSAGMLLPYAGLGRAAVSEGAASMQIQCAFGDQVFTATLEDNPSAREFAAMLPLELEIDDYLANEKIAYLPQKLSEGSSGRFSKESPGDLCYFAPWGNLAFFHGEYHYSNGLIRLGRLDGGSAPLLKRGKFLLRIETIPQP